MNLKEAVKRAKNELLEPEVKKFVKKWLEEDNWKVEMGHPNASGADIRAFKDGFERVIEVKGTPYKESRHAQPFAEAIGQLLTRMNDDNSEYFIALPNQKNYRNLWDKLPRLAKERTAIKIIFVGSDGHISQ